LQSQLWIEKAAGLTIYLGIRLMKPVETMSPFQPFA
jgi:hypothetical protein